MIQLKSSLIAPLLDAQPSIEDVRNSLQQAIELEHATIPTYLYGLYSLDPVKNSVIAEIIQSVVVEEMLHMTLASNLLNAIGGSPVIDKPEFIPTFPGPLPGGIDTGLIVHLAPFSMEQLETYLSIEEPENPHEYKVSAALEVEPQKFATIGQFYAAISEALGKLPEGSFHASPRNQIGPDLMKESVIVTDLKTARQAIDVIVEQGEGTSTSPADGEGDEVAHYYRFMEIKKGRALIPVPNSSPEDWEYAGEVIKLDPEGIYPIPTDPSSSKYPDGSGAKKANDTFNYTYTNLLKALHALFNGDGTREQFHRAIGLMMSTKELAKAMTSGIPNPVDMVGPSFEFLALDPG